MDDLKTWPASKYAFEKLEEMGRVKYGAIVKWPMLEELFNDKNRDGWPFRSEWFKLRELFEEAGFMVTEAAQNNEGFRILEREEMADAVKIRENKKANDSLRKSLTLSKVPREGLPDAAVKSLDHWEAKSALVGATSKILLRKRSLPSPETAIKSIHHYLKDQE